MPPKLVLQRREHQGWIGHPTGDDYIGPAGRRVSNQLRAEVGISRDDRLELAGWATGVGEDELGCLDPIEHIVTNNYRDAKTGEVEIASQLSRAVTGRFRVRRAHVAHDLDPAGGTSRQHAPQALGEERVIARGRVL